MYSNVPSSSGILVVDRLSSRVTIVVTDIYDDKSHAEPRTRIMINTDRSVWPLEPCAPPQEHDRKASSRCGQNYDG